MDIKKINKVGGATATGLVIAMLLIIGIFGGYYTFLAEQMEVYDTPLDSKYNDTYQLLKEEQADIDNQVTEIRESLNDVEEASNDFLAAIAGFKGLGAALLLLLTFIDSSFNIFTALFFSTDIIPTDVQNLLILGFISLVIFIFIAIFKGEGKM